MKKTLLYLATFAAAVSCDLYGGQETPKTADEPGSITISFSEVKDSSFVVNIAPAAEASYYSYLIDEDVEAAVLDSSKLYKVAYSSLAQGTVKWSAEEPSKTIKMDNLTPNTTYQVYAVAGSPMGYVGSVVVASVTTSDGVNPFPVKYSREDSRLAVTFAEPVKVGKGKFSASYYAYNSENIATGIPEGQVAESDIVVETEGNVATITVKNLPDGAFYTVSYEEGAFEDYTGNKVKGLTSSMLLNEETKYEPKYIGLGGRNAVGTFKLGSLGKEDEKYSTETPSFLVELGSEYGYGWTDDEKTCSVVYTMNNKTTSYVLSANVDFGYIPVRDKVAIFLPEAGVRGNSVSMTIEAGAFEDYYGNTNEEWTAQTLYSYGYSLDDVVGSYSGTGYANNKGEIAVSLTIAESDNQEKGNVMITQFMGIPCSTPIYGNFNVDSGVFNIYGEQPFYSYVDDNDTPDDDTDDVTVSYVFYTYDNYYLNLSMQESGKLGNPDDYFGIAIAEDGNLVAWGYLFLTFDVSKVQESAPAALSHGHKIEMTYGLDKPKVR